MSTWLNQLPCEIKGSYYNTTMSKGQYKKSRRLNNVQPFSSSSARTKILDNAMLINLFYVVAGARTPTGHAHAEAAYAALWV